jgi:hypothetical protein
MGLYLNLTGEVEFSVEQFGSIGVGQLWRMAVVAGTNWDKASPDTPAPSRAFRATFVDGAPVRLPVHPWNPRS